MNPEEYAKFYASLPTPDECIQNMRDALAKATRSVHKSIFRSRYLMINHYMPDVSIDIAKGRRWPHLRGTWLPSFDKQYCRGLAINFAGLRIRISWDLNGFSLTPQ